MMLPGKDGFSVARTIARGKKLHSVAHATARGRPEDAEGI
jgi:hypothetical protein